MKEETIAIADLVERAQRGDSEAMQELFAALSPFLGKYRTFFRSVDDMERMAKSHDDMAAFLALFAGPNLFHAVASRRWGDKVAGLLAQRMEEIVELVKEIGGYEEISAIIDMAFVDLVKRYDRDGKVRKELKKQGIDFDCLSDREKERARQRVEPVEFTGYAYNVFKWFLFKAIQAETRGVIPGVGWCKPYWTSDDEDGKNLAEALSDVADETDLEAVLTTGVDHAWVAGQTCSEPFASLTSRERWLLKARFVDGMGVAQIAHALGTNRATAAKMVEDAADRVRALAKRPA